MKRNHKPDPFSQFATATARGAGHPRTLVIAVGAVLVWALSGPAFHFSDTWQLVINTATTVVTFLMVFLIQNSQNRDSAAMHLKLDELLRSVKDAHNNLINSEEMTQQDLDHLRKLYARLAEKTGRSGE